MSEPKSNMNLQEIISDIEKNEILLPDFQRKFVWQEEDRQKKIVASVLTKMPIGSVLFLESEPDDYSSKQIGCKTIIDTKGLHKNVRFLLDGQQRITVLTNVFSNVIHNKCSKISDLVSPTLKRRFFLRIPKWTKCRNEVDLFGVRNLNFIYKDPDSNDPEFLSGDILSSIVCFSFNSGDKTPYNPHEDLSTELDTFCLNYEEGYLVPLFLMSPSSESNPSKAKLRMKTICKNIAGRIKDEIINYYTGLDSDRKSAFVDEIFFDDIEARDRIKKNYSLFGDEIEERANVWDGDLKDYLDSCVKNIVLNEIVVAAEKRARAIDIYENLNIGGVCLNIFDLIMAKVAKVDANPFYDRLIELIKKPKQYDKNVIPTNIYGQIKHNVAVDDNGNKKIISRNMIEDGTYNASIFTKCYNEEKNEIAQKYLDAFLNVLSLYTYNSGYKPDEYKIDLIKRNKILNLDADLIHKNTDKVCYGLDRALLFLQVRCGIRNISELNYSLMLSLIATVFTNDEWYSDVSVHNKLEAWYWSSVFGGKYDRDQNTVFIQDLQSVMEMLVDKKGTTWIENNVDYIFDAQNFSDEKLLLMEKTNEERYPKRVLRLFVCQYLLSKSYPDMFDDKEIISVFSSSADTLEAHHIIPLGSVKKVNDSTAELRKDEKNICNSPLNFVYITKKSNDAISDDTLDIYISKITDGAKSALAIQSYTDPSINGDKTKQILHARYVALKGDVKNKVQSLLI